MMKFILIFDVLIFYFFSAGFAQIPQNRVKFIPEYPNQNQSITLCYNIDSTIFHDRYEVLCKIFLTGINEDVTRDDFPKVVELNLLAENGLLCGSFFVPPKTTGIVAVFLDSLEVNIDNNNGEGYWSPVFTGRDILPGALSGIADLYAGGWPPQFHLQPRKDIARKLYERDFEMNPAVKRKFTRYYLATFNIYDPSDKEIFMKELNEYAHHKDLSEWELLLGVKNYYSMINAIDSVNKYEKLIFERYPNGSWALQKNSLPPAIEIDLMKDHKAKWEKYKEFKNRFCENYPDELTRNRMNDRLSQLLRGMVLSFAQNNNLTEWENEVAELDERYKYYTFKRSALFLIEHLKSLSLTSVNERSLIALKPEAPLFRFESSDENELILYSEKLARQSVTWYRQNLNAPRGILDKPYSTDKEILTQREELLASVLDILGQNLMLQNRLEEANQVFREAVDLGRRKDASINEHYIEALVKSGQVSEALKEAAIVISQGKSTETINNFYESIVGDTLSKDVAMADLKAQLKKQMISDDMPNGILLNTKGEKVSLQELKGKSIVIDFWATWCTPCIIGMKSAIPVIEKYKDKEDVVFLFVNTERISTETKLKVNRRLQEMDFDFNVFFDPDVKTTKAFKVEVIPTTFIIDSKGKIRFRIKGINIKKGKQELNDELTAMIELVR